MGLRDTTLIRRTSVYYCLVEDGAMLVRHMVSEPGHYCTKCALSIQRRHEYHHRWHLRVLLAYNGPLDCLDRDPQTPPAAVDGCGRLKIIDYVKITGTLLAHCANTDVQRCARPCSLVRVGYPGLASIIC
jgi:hypothetical protein